MPTTRQQIEFKKSVMEARTLNKLTTSIFDSIITSIQSSQSSLTSKLEEKCKHHKGKIIMFF